MRIAPSSQRRGRQRLIRGLIGVGVLVVILEFISRLGIVNAYFLPPFSEVLWNAVLLFGNLSFLIDLLSTVSVWALGLAISFAIAVPLGVLFGLSNLSYRLSRSFIEIIRPMPSVALVPLLLVAFGQGIETKLVITVYASIWPILFNTIYGVHGAVPLTKDMAKVFGFKPVEVVGRVILPSAAPFIATGVRISSSIALIVLITAEMLSGASTGLGAFITAVRATGQAPVLAFAGVLITGVLGLAINSAMSAIEHRWFAWQDQTR